MRRRRRSFPVEVTDWSSKILIVVLVISNQMLQLILAKTANLEVLGKSPVGFYLRINKRIWQSLPSGARNFYPVRCYGAWLHTLVRLHANRRQYFGTFFLRNRPALELMRRLAQQKVHGSTLRISV